MLKWIDGLNGTYVSHFGPTFHLGSYVQTIAIGSLEVGEP